MNRSTSGYGTPGRWIILVVCFMLLHGHGAAIPTPDAPPKSKNLASLSLEELMQIEVVTVSRKEEKGFVAPAAVFILTSEDLSKAGIRLLPDAFRLAPGVQVGHVDANKWGISARGFNSLFSTKLLVLKDARSLYSRIFSGIFWESQDVFMPDVDRIEIIRGPGSTLWGANAVNGVFNILTKSATETMGGLAEVGIGTQEKRSLQVRYGFRASDKVWMRLYGKAVDRAPLVDAAGKASTDAWRWGLAGVRMDLPMGQDHLMVAAEAQVTRAGKALNPAFFEPGTPLDPGPARIACGHLLLRWEHRQSDRSGWVFRGFMDTYHRKDPLLIGGVFRQYDLDFQHRLPLGHTHDVMWGMGYRLTTDRIENSLVVDFNPAHRDYALFNIFLQDEIRFLPDRLHLTVGSKLEWTDDTGHQFEPNIRVRWSPSRNQTLWAALARAIRTPSRGDRDYRLTRYLGTDQDLRLWFRLEGHKNLPVEVLYAYELGYRFSRPTYLIDLAAFVNRYRDLRVFEPGNPYTESRDGRLHLYIPYLAASSLDGRSHGIEADVDWIPWPWMKLRLVYAYFFLDLRSRPGSLAIRPLDAEKENPRHQASALVALQPMDRFSMGLTLRFVDRLPVLEIDRYLTADLSLGYRVGPKVSLGLLGQNLFDRHHPEFAFETLAPFARLEVRRSLLLTTRLGF